MYSYLKIYNLGNLIRYKCIYNIFGKILDREWFRYIYSKYNFFMYII